MKAKISNQRLAKRRGIAARRKWQKRVSNGGISNGIIGEKMAKASVAISSCRAAASLLRHARNPQSLAKESINSGESLASMRLLQRNVAQRIAVRINNAIVSDNGVMLRAINVVMAREHAA